MTKTTIDMMHSDDKSLIETNRTNSNQRGIGTDIFGDQDNATKEGLEIVKRAKTWIANGFEGHLVATRIGGKAAFEDGWNSDAPWPTEKLLKRLERGYGFGVRTKRFPAVDIEESAQANKILEIAQANYPDAPIRSRPGTTSKALLLHRAENEPTKRFRLLRLPDEALLMEVLGATQLHSGGFRSDKGNVWLKWDRAPVVAKLPVVTNDQIEQFCRDVIDALKAEGVQAELRIQDDKGVISGGDPATEEEVAADSVYRLFEDLGMVKNNKPNKTGWVDVVCPWADEHTDPTQDTAGYHPGAGGFSCFHAHCQGKGMNDVREWLDKIAPADTQVSATNAAAGELFRKDGYQDPFEDKADYLSKSWRDALARLREAQDEVGHKEFYGDDGGEGFITFDLNKQMDLPLIRPDITDWHSKGEVSIMASAPGTGKSTLCLLYALAICLERPELVGLTELDWTGDVVLVSNEDRFATIQSKLAGFKKKLGLVDGDFKHKIHLWNERLAVVSKTGALGIAPTRNAVRFVDRLADLRKTSCVSLVIVDTLASAVEGGDENASGDMQALMNHCIDIAVNGFCAVTLIHHVKKAAGDSDDDVSMNDVRGSGALVGAARMVVGVAKCGSGREVKHGWTADERSRSIRFAGLKANNRPTATERFYRFENMDMLGRDVRGFVKNTKVGVLDLLPAPAPLVKDWKAETRAALDAALHAGQELVLDKQAVGKWDARSAVKHVLESVSGDAKKDRAAVFNAIGQLIGEGVYYAQNVRNNAGNYKTVLGFK